jgi:RNA polymerase sigma factor (sigma-70 family)
MAPSAGTDDLALLLAWRDGDAEAGNELGRRHFLGTLRFFTAKVPEVAEELVQRTVLACVEGKERIGIDAGFRAYLFGVARKQLLHHFEGRGELRGVDQLSQRSILDLRTSPSQAIAAEQDHALLVATMQRLPIDFQIVLELFYWESMSLVEIAAALDVAVGTVKSRLSRARDQLRAQLERAGNPALGASMIRRAPDRG